MNVPYEQGRPIWIDDDRFDITYHVRHTALPKPGSWEQLVALTTRVQESLLDRERPLWELWFVEGLEGGNIAIVQKTHHALIDGVSGVDVATMLLDMSPDYVQPQPIDWKPEPAPSATQLLVDTVRERLTEPTEIVRSIRHTFRGPRLALAEAQRLGQSMGTMVNRERDRADHVDQRADRPAPTAVGRARAARRRQAGPARARWHRERRRARGRRRRPAPAVPTSRRDDCRAPLAGDDPGVGAGRRAARRARQQGVGDVRVASGRQHPGDRTAGRGVRADPPPQGPPAGHRRRLPDQHERLRRADVDESGRARRPPAAVLESGRHQRARVRSTRCT